MSDRTVLEACLVQYKNQRDHFRAIGDRLQEALAQADMDRILDELGKLYKGRQKQC